jgi:hypothetical protein
VEGYTSRERLGHDALALSDQLRGEPEVTRLAGDNREPGGFRSARQKQGVREGARYLQLGCRWHADISEQH